MIKNVILPGNIDVSGHFWNTFGRVETESAARALVRLFQKQNPGSWEPIPWKADFCLHGLSCNRMLTVENGTLSITDEFIRMISRHATIEHGKPRSKNPIKRLGSRLWAMANQL